MVVDVELYTIAIADDEDGEPGAFVNISDVTNTSPSHSEEGESEIPVFGGEPHIRAGRDVHEYGVDAILNPADSTGQGLLLDSWKTKANKWIRVLYDGANGYYQKIRVTSWDDPADADGDLLRISFTARGIGDLIDLPEES